MSYWHQRTFWWLAATGWLVTMCCIAILARFVGFYHNPHPYFWLVIAAANLLSAVSGVVFARRVLASMEGQDNPPLERTGRVK